MHHTSHYCNLKDMHYVKKERERAVRNFSGLLFDCGAVRIRATLYLGWWPWYGNN